MSGHHNDCVCNEPGCKKEITDTDRLNWMIEQSRYVISSDDKKHFYLSSKFDPTKFSMRYFKSPRDAIDAAMKESDEKSGT